MPASVSSEDLQGHAIAVDAGAWVANCLAARRGGAGADEVQRVVRALARLAPAVTEAAAHGPGAGDAAAAFDHELAALARG